MMLGWRALLAYATLRMPLALLELPLFVLLPSFYGGTLGMDLALVGGVLFSVRLIDAVVDPAIGAAIDRGRARRGYGPWIYGGLLAAVAGFALLLLPPVRGEALVLWLALASTITCLAYSAISIAYQSWGAELGRTDAERARVTGTREAFGLAGVLAASALLTPEHATALVVAFGVLSLACASLVPRWPRATPLAGPTGERSGWGATLGRPAFRWLIAAFLLNGIATAIPATLVLFFVRDVLGTGDASAAMFLGAYFLAGAIGMPMWIALARRIGLRHAWLAGISASVLAFAWTLSLGQGDVAPFMAVCVLTGLALGSDLALPSALLASVISDAGHSGRDEGRYFGVWNLATKLSLAAAAGLALPLLSALDYRPGGTDGTLALSIVYAALPCAMKIAAALTLLLAPLPEAVTQPPLDKGVTP
jgi:GPH family glycoside/pentoside/hexuronide:cation symporter